MRKIIIIAAAMLSGIALNAQDIWVKASFVDVLEYQKTILSTDTTVDNFLGGQLGVELEIPINDFLAIAPGIDFEMSGANDTGYKNFNMGLSIPLLARVGFNCSDNVRIFVNAGPDAFIGLYDKTTEYIGILSQTYNSYTDGDDPRFQYYTAVGAGIDFLKKFRLQARYDFGIANKSNPAIKTRYDALLLSLAYKF